MIYTILQTKFMKHVASYKFLLWRDLIIEVLHKETLPLVTNIFSQLDAAAALRMVPRLPGSLMLSQIKVNGIHGSERSDWTISLVGLLKMPDGNRGNLALIKEEIEKMR